MAFAASSRKIQIDCNFGGSDLLCTSVGSSESISSAFIVDANLVAQGGSIDLSSCLGQKVAISAEGTNSTRHYHGIVETASLVGYEQGSPCYDIVIVPTLKLLEYQNDHRIFQDKDSMEIVNEILRAAGITDVRNSVRGPLKKKKYCVQYKENSYDFVLRLLAEDGISFYFEHSASRHMLVFTNQSSGYGSTGISVRYRGGVNENATLINWKHTSSYNAGSHTSRIYNETTPHNILTEEKNANLRPRNNSKFNSFSYHDSSWNEKSGADISRLILERDESLAEQVSGGGEHIEFLPGHTFSVGDHLESSEAGQSYLIVGSNSSVSEPLGGDATSLIMQAHFRAIPSSTNYRPPQSPKPIQLGTHTATVTGPQNDEVHTDEFGRIKLQFHWDHHGASDQNSSCWMRVSQSWAGNAYGNFYLPRVGQEVLVSYVDGDIDQPIVTGCLYNGLNKVPFRLPSEKLQSGIKTHSSPNKPKADHNSFVFDDKAGMEKIILHAQKDQSITVENDRQIKVNNDLLIEVVHNRIELVKANKEDTIEGNQTTTVTGDITSDTTGNVTHSSQGTTTHNASSDLVLESQQSITLSCGAASIELSPDGSIKLNGVQITVNGSGPLTLKGTPIAIN
jgi:type VI secretion system secreted protein VgrG